VQKVKDGRSTEWQNCADDLTFITSKPRLELRLVSCRLPTISAWRRIIDFMPTYEYHCQKCAQNFEAFQSMRDEPFRECPKDLCRLPKWGHGKVKRLLGTGAGVIFKGSGFYTTDYRSASYKEAAKKEAPVTSTAGEKSTARKEAGSKDSSSVPAKTPEKKSRKESAG